MVSFQNGIFQIILILLRQKQKTAALTAAYEQRALTMVGYFETIKGISKVIAKEHDDGLPTEVDCACDVCHLAKFLFQSTPSLKGEAACIDEDCPNIVHDINLPIIEISIWEMVNRRTSFIGNFAP